MHPKTILSRLVEWGLLDWYNDEKFLGQHRNGDNWIWMMEFYYHNYGKISFLFYFQYLYLLKKIFVRLLILPQFDKDNHTL
ncbi:MAG: hypothetical protein RLZZ495_1107 [Pseudomonadota bacterium]